MADQVWYAGYGSNLDRQRFLCYILGGRPALGRIDQRGSSDRTPPAESRILSVRHRLYFALPGDAAGSANWGPGGVAFIDPIPGEGPETICRMWLITGQQYEDVREQEGLRIYDTEVALGEAEDIPILAVSCAGPTGQVAPPSAAYLKTIALGLKQAAGLDAEEIAAYLLQKDGIKGRLGKQDLMELLEGLDEDRSRC